MMQMIIKLNYWFEREKEIFKNISNERLDKLEQLTKKVIFDNSKYFIESSNMEIDFSGKEDPITFLSNVKTNRITINEQKIHKKILINN